MKMWDGLFIKILILSNWCVWPDKLTRNSYWREPHVSPDEENSQNSFLCVETPWPKWDPFVLLRSPWRGSRISSLFFGLLPTDDNPTAFVDIKANFFNTRRWIYPVCLVGLSPTTYRATRLIVVDRLLQIGVIVFDYASMPFNFVVERILLKSIIIDGRDLKTPRLSSISPCQIRPGNLPPETSLSGFVDV